MYCSRKHKRRKRHCGDFAPPDRHDCKRRQRAQQKRSAENDQSALRACIEAAHKCQLDVAPSDRFVHDIWDAGEKQGDRHTASHIDTNPFQAFPAPGSFRDFCEHFPDQRKNHTEINRIRNSARPEIEACGQNDNQKK